MTEKLYYEDSHLAAFTARVTDCRVNEKGGYIVLLDRTAFFPEGGGQLADTGRIGDVRVLDVHEREGEIRHYTDAPLTVGAEYECALDFEQRWRRMQNHSGEHTVSGLVHARFGADNVGFHMGAECMTLDFNREIAWDELMDIERRANEIVRENLPVKTWFPAPEELALCSPSESAEMHFSGHGYILHVQPYLPLRPQPLRACTRRRLQLPGC